MSLSGRHRRLVNSKGGNPFWLTAAPTLLRHLHSALALSLPLTTDFYQSRFWFLKPSIAMKVTGNIFISIQVLQLLFPTAVASELKVWCMQLSKGSSFVSVHLLFLNLSSILNLLDTCNTAPAVQFYLQFATRSRLTTYLVKGDVRKLHITLCLKKTSVWSTKKPSTCHTLENITVKIPCEN